MDEREFDELYAAQWQALVGQVTLLCGDPVEAADCVQEAFVRAWECRNRLDPDAGGWVRSTALRISINRWHRARNAMTAWTRQHRQSVVPTSEVHGYDEPTCSALARLPQKQREVVVLHHVLDLSVQQVADIVGSPEGTVKARLARGRQLLKVLLADAGNVQTHATTEGTR